ncbi:tRNA lysidine(34) synthetase TilS [Streptococcus plurextorum]|uniref:tRNA lysidine(34) synthetase TilS n=1 Tax=Streptococcus plurextorum TaxID=456876 RepID=UPI000487AB87|nr:tRNA lysidine(34) synthetase TilS [Streptococcus plurextorum]
MIYQTLFEHVTKHHFFDHHSKVLIAVSGGVDSMNLLHFLSLYQEKLGITLGIAHVNHKQRPESDQEELYLRQWAKEQGLPFYCSYFSGVFSEKAARDFRYSFFKQVMNDDKYTALVTAHHADDQAETILMKMLRGSRLRHLTGIKAVQDFGPGQLIRPLLAIKKSDLPDTFHFEDDSNYSRHYLRNRVRNDYLPLFQKENPQFSTYLTELAREIQLLQEALADLLASIDIRDLAVFKRQSPVLQELLLENYLEHFPELQLSRAQFKHLLALLSNDKTYQIPLKNGYECQKTQENFSIYKISPKTDSTLQVKVLKITETCRCQEFSFHFSESGEGYPLDSQEPIILRNRQAEDRIDFGTFSKTLRRLFIDEKVPQSEREKAIVGEQNGKILFVQTKHKLYLRKSPENVTMKATLSIQKLEDR